MPSSHMSHTMGICFEWRRAAVGRVLHWMRRRTSFSLGGMKEALRILKASRQLMFGSMLFHFS